MFNTVTITSKDRLISEKSINLSSLTNYRIETVTIPAGTLVEKLFAVDNIDSDMRSFETAAIFDFLKFEKEN
jgi:hypothetical protein